MDATTIAGNPFAVLTAIAAPAILTNASSVLALGTSNRLARVVDRTRFVTAQLAELDTSSAEYDSWASQLGGLRIRARLLVDALGAIYGSLGLFAAAALVSIVGSIASYDGRQYVFELAAILAIAKVLRQSSDCRSDACRWSARRALRSATSRWKRASPLPTVQRLRRSHRPRGLEF